MRTKKFWAVLLLMLTTTLSIRAAQVDTVQVKSEAMNKIVRVLYVVPDVAMENSPQACPVVYLLHGYKDNFKAWIGIKPELPQIADDKGMIFVCPDGENSWYWDSPLHADSQYETFISQELVAYTDANYATIARREGRAITGYSMGGHGALWNAIHHQDVFGAAGSTSGGVDIRPFPQNWLMKNQLGEYASNKKRWDEHTVINQIGMLHQGSLALIIDCGEEDFFLEVNKTLHQRLLARGIDHDFITRPGGHRAAYWANAIDYQLLFFEKFFKKGTEYEK